jgi:hypothetical protein
VRATKVFLASLASTAIVYDVLAYALGGEGATISEVVYDWSVSPSLPFAFGALGGHLFWAAPEGSRTTGQKFAGLAALLVASGAMLPLSSDSALLPVAAGVVAGRVLWPQTPRAR